MSAQEVGCNNYLPTETNPGMKIIFGSLLSVTYASCISLNSRSKNSILEGTMGISGKNCFQSLTKSSVTIKVY